MTKPKLTICIVHYRKLDKLKKTIDHIRNNTKVAYNVKILNQGYTNKSIKKYLEKINQEKNFEVIFGKKNLGPSGGRSVLFENFKTPYVLSLDDDVYLPSNWFSSIKKFMMKNTNVGAVGISQKSPSGEILSTARNLKQENRILKVSRFAITQNPLRARKKFHKVDDINEGAMVLRKEVANDIRWDKSLSVTFEGLDKGLQLKNLGFDVYIYTGFIAIHDSVSKKRNYNAYNRARRNYKEIHKNYLYFCNKWDLRLPLSRHIFYKYICSILPNSTLKNIAYLWLNRIKPIIK